MLEKNVRICDLFDLYGGFLSQRQQIFVKEYYFSNNSLSEIAQNWNISRQAVLDSLAKSEKRLEEFEAKLSLLEIKKLVYSLNENTANKQVINKIKNLI